MVGARHVVVAELTGVVEDEVVGNEFDGSFGEIGEVHYGDILDVLGPTVSFEEPEGAGLATALAVGGNEDKGLLLKRLGQTDHAGSELLAAASSTPDNEEGDFAFEIGGSL